MLHFFQAAVQLKYTPVCRVYDKSFMLIGAAVKDVGGRVLSLPFIENGFTYFLSLRNLGGSQQ